MSQLRKQVVYNVNSVFTWIENNTMKVNTDKFQCIIFGRNEHFGSLKIRKNDIFSENIVKILRLNLDSGLHFDTHISKLG